MNLIDNLVHRAILKPNLNIFVLPYDGEYEKQIGSHTIYTNPRLSVKEWANYEPMPNYVFDYIQKPFGSKEFVNRVKVLLRVAKAQQKIYLKLVPKSHKLYVKWFIEHYPKSKGIVGRQLNFLIYSYGNPIGIIGFASPPLNYKKFNVFFAFDTNISSSENAKLFLNNNVFRIVYSEKNLGTQILKLARKNIYKIYQEKYNQKLLGLVTFIEPPRTGSMYKADNWIYIGETDGVEIKRRGENWINKQYTIGVKKLIYGYKY
jgi:hypothetical protein